MAVLRPMTSPLMLIKGPPLLPWLMAQSVCIISRYCCPSTFNDCRRALMMPRVTVCSKPNGEPIAIAQSPTLILSESPRTASPTEIPYHSAKRAMESAMKSFFREYSSKNIRFNVISPGLMNTPMGQAVLKIRPNEVDKIPLGRLIRTKDIG